MQSPLFITLEGIDKTGKTLLWNLIKIDFPDFRYISDPPKMDPWDSIFTNGSIYDKEIPQISESFLLLAARLHNNVKIISQVLNQGESIVSDRYADSWIAYQTISNTDLFSNIDESYKFFTEIHQLFKKNKIIIDPTITFLIIADIDIIEQRLSRTKHISKYEEIEYLSKVQEIYLRIANESPERVYVLQDKNQGICNIYDEILSILKKKGLKSGPL